MSFISFMELIGTIAFAAAGALVAIKKNLDYYGICFFALITALGGGVIRDVLINRPIPVALENPLYAVISLLTVLILVFLYEKIRKYHDVLMVLDAIGLGAFTSIGCEVAVANGFTNPWIIITLGLLTGTGGGALRDVFAREIPVVFQKEIYAVASLMGGIFFWIFLLLHQETIGVYASFAITVIIRYGSVKKDIHLGRMGK